MSDYITHDGQLDDLAESIARDIFEEFKAEHGAEFDPDSLHSEMSERVWQDCDGNENVIYTARAMSICANCSTDEGEQWLEGVYSSPFEGCETFAEVCTRLAFATLLQATENALSVMMNDYEPDESDDESDDD